MPTASEDPEDTSDRSDSKNKVCKICNKTVTRSASVKCSNSDCNVILHTKCLETVAKVFDNVKKTKWLCKLCSEHEQVEKQDNNEQVSEQDISVHMLFKEVQWLKKEIVLLNKVIVGLESQLKTQDDKLERISPEPVSNLSHSNKPAMLYSTMVKKQNSAPLLVKSTKQTSDIDNTEIMKELKSKVNLAESNICVDNTRLIKGGVLVQCENVNSLNILKQKLKDNFGSKYNVNEPKLLNPRIRINNVDLNMDDETIVKDILLHNRELENSKIKIVTKLKRKFSQNVVIEVQPATRNIMNKKGHLYIGWKKCYIQDHCHVIRCYRCSRFGHSKKDCKNVKLCCYKCSGEHEFINCDSNVRKCINCVNYNNNSKDGNAIPTDHWASDENCPIYCNKLTILKNRTNYGG